MKNLSLLLLIFCISFSLFAQPKITGFSPISGTVGAVVCIRGTGFSPKISENTVYFGKLKAQVLDVSPTELSVLVPAAGSIVPISLNVNGLVCSTIMNKIPNFHFVRPLQSELYYEKSKSMVVHQYAKTDNYVPMLFETADINEDGKMDIVVVNNQKQMRYFLGNGDGTFLAPKTVNFSTHISYDCTLADVNQDNHLDFVTADAKKSAIYFGDGKGNFATPKQFSYSGAESLMAAILARDVNQDGNVDLLLNCWRVPSGTEGNLIRILGDGKGNFANAEYYKTPCSLCQVNFVDLNDDQKIDVLISAFRPYTETPKLIILFGNNKVFDLPTYYHQILDFVSLAVDMNHDNKEDLIILKENAKVSVILGKDNNAFELEKTFDVPISQISTSEISDFDADGNLDLLIASYNSNDFAILRSDGKGNFVQSITFQHSFRNVHSDIGGFISNRFLIEDFNQDGKLDWAILGNILNGEEEQNIFTIFLNKTCPMIEIRPDSLEIGTHAQAYKLAIAQNGLENSASPLVWSAKNLPKNMIINSKTGEISGTPNASGIFEVTISVKSGVCETSKNYVLKVKPAMVQNILAVLDKNKIKLSWSCKTPDVMFDIEKSVLGSNQFTKIAENLNSAVLSYEDKNIEKGKKYVYRIASKNGIGQSTSENSRAVGME